MIPEPAKAKHVGEPSLISEQTSLWESLHDGYIVRFVSDTTARTVLLFVESEFHMKFHGLPAETRFRILGEGVTLTEALASEPWPGAIEPPPEMPWDEAQAIRQRNWQMGRYVSTDWNEFVMKFETDEDFLIMNAVVGFASSKQTLKLEVMTYPNSMFRELRIEADQFRFFADDREMSLIEFEAFGGAYWKARSERTTETEDNKATY